MEFPPHPAVDTKRADRKRIFQLATQETIGSKAQDHIAAHEQDQRLNPNPLRHFPLLLRCFALAVDERSIESSFWQVLKDTWPPSRTHCGRSGAL